MIKILLLVLSISFVQAYTCESKYDHLDIPHTKTLDEHNFYYCFGYQHALDRAWEMDYFRRTAQGRNAEVLGYTHLKSDLMMRLLDLESLAKRLWSEFPLERRFILEQYSLGANEGFKLGKKSPEFDGLEPDVWEPHHSLLVLLLQSFDQTRKTFTRDYEEELVKKDWGIKTESLFNEDDVPWMNTILKEGEYVKKPSSKQTSYQRPSVQLPPLDFPNVFGKESGSNNWVVSKNKSSSGHAILANDPHLDLKTPLFWYWIHLLTPESEIIGASLPGVPVIASGTNGKVSWGLTNAYINTADAVAIKDLKDSELESFRPTVMIKFGPIKLPFFFKSFEKTKSGHPILPLEMRDDLKIALRWTGYNLKPQDILGMFELRNPKTTVEMNELLKELGIPAWNFVFADTKGDIGFRVVGQAYKQENKNSYGVMEMTLKEFENPSFLTPMERPAVLNPKRNYIYTANNRHWPPDSQFYGGRGYSDSFRGLRIDELLQKSHDLQSTGAIQCDGEVIDARFFLPLLQKYISDDRFKTKTLFALDDSTILPIYRRLMDLTMKEWKVNEYALYHLLQNLSEKQITELRSFLKISIEDTKGKNWKSLHRLSFPHLSKNPDWIFSPHIAGPGDKHTVNPGTATWNEEKKIFEQSSGASMRMIIEMREKPVIKLSLPGLNRNYNLKSSKEPWQRWRSCIYESVEF